MIRSFGQHGGHLPAMTMDSLCLSVSHGWPPKLTLMNRSSSWFSTTPASILLQSLSTLKVVDPEGPGCGQKELAKDAIGQRRALGVATTW